MVVQLTGSLNDKIEFWFRFFDTTKTSNHRFHDDVTTLLDLLARGNYTDGNTLVSREFARKLWNSFKKIGIVDISGP